MRRYERRISFVLGSLLLLILTVGALLWAVLTAYAPPVLYRPLLGAAVTASAGPTTVTEKVSASTLVTCRSMMRAP